MVLLSFQMPVIAPSLVKFLIAVLWLIKPVIIFKESLQVNSEGLGFYLKRIKG